VFLLHPEIDLATFRVISKFRDDASGDLRVAGGQRQTREAEDPGDPLQRTPRGTWLSSFWKRDVTSLATFAE
jgi:hypothetical protein